MADLKIMDSLKDLGGAAAGLAAIAYASGYLVLRARARALGTDPSLTLVEEAYVFAGFRFLLSLLIALLLALPLVALVRAVTLWLARVLPASAHEPAQWAALVALGLVVLLEFRVLGVSQVLLQPEAAAAGSLADAVLGRTALGLWLVLGTAALSALSILWLMQVPRPGLSVFSAGLAIIVALQVLLLPVYHGMFFADQTVRVLDGVPPKAAALVAPVGIVDRGGDHVTLLGATKAGERRLVMLAKKDVEGLAVSRVTALRTFLDTLGKAAVGIALVAPIALSTGMRAEAATGQTATKAQPRQTMDARESSETFWKVVVDYLKNTLEYVGALGEGRADAGQIWIAELNGTDLRAPARPLASFKQLSWPVFGPGGEVYALEGRHVVRIGRDGAKSTLAGSEADWIKLVGVGSDGSILGVVADPPFGRATLLLPKGGLALGPAPSTADEKKRQAVLLQESRSYQDGRRITLRNSQRGRGLDVFLEAPGKVARNLSDCGDDACGQPSLSPDGTRAAWIRSSL